MQIIDTILGRMCLFTGFAFYIAVRCGFDKHLYLTSCLNAHNRNTRIRLPQTGCTARKMAHSSLLVKIGKQQDQYLPLMPWPYIINKLEYVISSFKWRHVIDSNMLLITLFDL